MPTRDDYDESEHVKETFAYYGRAAYTANVVETGLAHALMQIEFLTSVRDEFVRTKGLGFDRSRYEADFDAFMARQFAKTMGTLKNRVEKLGDFDDGLKKRIHLATERRNFLMHNYWREMAELFATREGRTKMIAELENDAEMFEKLDEDIQAATEPVRQRLGIRDDVVNPYVEAYIAKFRD
jgi:hypothetical protein